MRTESIEFESNGVTLSGTLTLPNAENTPVTVLMLHGTGPLDRDENMKGQKLDVFNTLADGFARAGIGSLRYDKRGCGASGGRFDRAGFHDLIDDACAAVDMLSRRSDTGEVVLLGHSEGTVLAPVVSVRRQVTKGMILLCPTVDPLERTLLRQADRLSEAIGAMPGIRGWVSRFIVRLQGGIPHVQRKMIDRVRRSSRKTMSNMGSRFSALWLREFLDHDLDAWMRKTTVPVLAISGEKDIQCLPGDSSKVAALASGPTEAHCLDNLTHLLRADDASPSFLRYEALLGKPLDARLVTLCTNWIRRQISTVR